MSVFGPDLLGRSLAFRLADDPPGAWVYEMDGEEIAEMSWSRDAGGVRMETAAGICVVAFRGMFVLRGAVLVGEDEVVAARYRGGLARGRARVEPGRVFDFFCRVDGDVGPWRGVDDEERGAVLRARARIDAGMGGQEVLVSADPRHAPFVGPLLAILGAVQVVRWARPWLGVATFLARS